MNRVQPVKLKNVSFGEVSLCNQLLSMGKGLNVMYRDSVHQISFTQPLKPLNDQFILNLKLGDLPIIRLSDIRWPELSFFEPSFVHIDEDPIKNELMQNDVFLGSLVRQFLLGMNISPSIIQDMQFQNEERPDYFVGVAFSSSPQSLIPLKANIYFTQSEIQPWLDILYQMESINNEESYEGLNLNFNVRIGYVNLGFEQIKSIQKGDFIFADHPSSWKEPIEISMSYNNIVIKAYFLNNQLEVKAVQIEEQVGVDENNEVGPGSYDLPEEASFNSNQIEMRMNFEIGQKQITLGELKNIREGYIFSLENPLDQCVTIKVNGQKLGTGELVSVDGRVGVLVNGLNRHV